MWTQVKIQINARSLYRGRLVDDVLRVQSRALKERDIYHIRGSRQPDPMEFKPYGNGDDNG